MIFQFFAQFFSIRFIFFILSISSGAVLIYYYWEAMLISYLSTRVTSIPFNSMQGLLNSSYSFYTEPGSSYWDTFKFGNPIWKEIFDKKLKPYEEEYNDFMVNTDKPWTWVLEEGDRAVYLNYDIPA